MNIKCKKNYFSLILLVPLLLTSFCFNKEVNNLQLVSKINSNYFTEQNDVEKNLISDIKNFNFYKIDNTFYKFETKENEFKVYLENKKNNKKYLCEYFLPINGSLVTNRNYSVSTNHGGHLSFKSSSININNNNLKIDLIINEPNMGNLIKYNAYENSKLLIKFGNFNYEQSLKKLYEKNIADVELLNYCKENYGFFNKISGNVLNFYFNKSNLFNGIIYSKKVYSNKMDSDFLDININENVMLSYISKMAFVNEIDLSNLLKIKPNRNNLYDDNGKVWSSPRFLNFSFNNKFIYYIQYLKNIYDGYNYLVDFKTKNISFILKNYKAINSYNNIIDNISNYDSSFDEIKKDCNSILNNFLVLKKNRQENKFNDMKLLNIFIPNLFISKDVHGMKKIEYPINLAYPYFLILNILKNYNIEINYSTPLKKASKIIWENYKFNPIEMESNSESNLNFIELNSIKFIPLNTNITYDIKINNFKNINDGHNFNNISNTQNGIMYRTLYRKDAKNYNNLIQEKISIFNQIINNINVTAIELNLNKYVSEIIDLNNNFIFPNILENVNKVFKIENNNSINNYDLFYKMSSIENEDNWKNFKNFNDALLKFKLKEINNKKINFIRDNKNGFFYGIFYIKKWKFKNDLDNYAQGNFTNNFINIFLNNSNVYELKWKNKATSDGAFLIKFKTNLTVPYYNFREIKNINYDNEFYSPLKYLSKSNTLKSINKKISLLKSLKYKENNSFLFNSKLDYLELDENKIITLTSNKFKIKNIIDKEYVNKYLYPLLLNPIQNIFFYIWNCSINFSNEKTNNGKIISRENLGNYFNGEKNIQMYKYNLNKNYTYNIQGKSSYDEISNDENNEIGYLTIWDKSSSNNLFSMDMSIKEIKQLYNDSNFLIDNDDINNYYSYTYHTNFFNIFLIFIIFLFPFVLFIAFYVIKYKKNLFKFKK